MGFFSAMRRFSQNTPGMGWMYTLAWNSGLVQAVQRAHKTFDSGKKEVHLGFDIFYNQNEEKIKEVSNLLEDDFSRKTLYNVLTYRRTGDKKPLKDIIVKNEYFQKDIFCPVKDEVFVDGGAYIGDTVRRFVENFAGGGYKRIYAWEPDEINRRALNKSVSFHDYKNVVVVPCGMWREKTQLKFSAKNNSGSRFVSEGEQEVQMVDVDSIDNVCAEDKVTFIKMDIEGSELAALEGAVSVIKRDKPRLAICVYHKPEDLYEIPFWIKKAVPEYKLYLRHHDASEHDTVLYATL